MKQFVLKHKNVLLLCVIFGVWITVMNADYNQQLRDCKYESIFDEIDKDYENGIIDWCQHQQLMSRLKECDEHGNLHLFYWDNVVPCNYDEIMEQLNSDYYNHDILDWCEYLYLQHRADSLEAIGQIWQFEFTLEEYVETDDCLDWDK